MKHNNERTRKVGYSFQSFSSKAPVPLIRISGKWLAEAGFDVGQEFSLTVQEGEIRLIRAETEEDAEEVEKGGNRANKAV